MNAAIKNKLLQPSADIQALREAVNSDAFSDSTKLHRLTAIVKLAAFASEARRTLEGIDSVLSSHPKTFEAIRTSLSGPSNWVDMDDVVSDVLRDVGNRLDDLSNVIGNRPFERQTLGGAGHE